MPRTTLDIDGGVLRELRLRRKKTGKSIGQIASELLADALREGDDPPQRRVPMRWRSAPMGARVNIDDKELVRQALEGPGGP